VIYPQNIPANLSSSVYSATTFRASGSYFGASISWRAWEVNSVVDLACQLPFNSLAPIHLPHIFASIFLPCSDLVAAPLRWVSVCFP
jgi:hypothetical protein